LHHLSVLCLHLQFVLHNSKLHTNVLPIQHTNVWNVEFSLNACWKI
jgi:hypothetical protein